MVKKNVMTKAECLRLSAMLFETCTQSIKLEQREITVDSLYMGVLQYAKFIYKDINGKEWGE